MKLSHIDFTGKPKMVDISAKQTSLRTAEAMATVEVGEKVARAISSSEIAKGPVLTVAQLAGITGGKKTSELIPLCHPLPIDSIDVSCTLQGSEVKIIARAKTHWKTGIEMEVLTAAAISALTVYDMCKAISKSIVIKEIKLLKKTGGKSGTYQRR